MRRSTKQSIAAIVAITFPIWIAAAIIAAPVMLLIFIIGDVYDYVLSMLNVEE